MRVKFLFTIFLILIFPFLLSESGFCQNNGSNGIGHPDSTLVEPMIELEEISLDTININAEIEKPRVAIVPRRMSPEVGELEFVNRSFEHELKRFPKKPLIRDDRLFKPQKIDNIAKKVIRKKGNLKKENEKK